MVKAFKPITKKEIDEGTLLDTISNQIVELVFVVLVLGIIATFDEVLDLGFYFV